MRPSPAQLTAFTMAARHRSFTRAAAALGVTQSSVTQHVAKLEAIMGAPLFIRRRDGLELTRAARELFEVTSPLRDLEDLAAEKVGDFSSLEHGELRIVANAPRPAMEFLSRFVTDHPKIAIDFSLASWTAALERLRDQKADIAVISDPPDDGDLFTRLIAAAPFVALVKKKSELHGPLALSDLARSRIILPEDGSLTQKRVRQLALRTGAELGPIVKTTTFPMVQEAVLHGVGVGVLLKDALYPHEGLRMLPIRGLEDDTSTCFATLRERRNLRLIKRFMETVV